MNRVKKMASTNTMIAAVRCVGSMDTEEVSLNDMIGTRSQPAKRFGEPAELGQQHYGLV